MGSRGEEQARRREERLESERAEALKARRRRRLFQLGMVAGLAAVLVVVAILVSQSGSGSPSAGKRGPSGVIGAAETADLLRGIPQNGTVLGDLRAPVTLTEYADLECPFCARYSRDVLPTIIDRYVRPGRVKLDLRLLRFISPDSNRAAKAALVAVRSDRSWNFVDLFYRNQGREGTGYATDAFVERLGRAVPGLDGGALIGRAGDPTIERRLTAFEAQATAGRVNSTPSFEIQSGGGSSKRLDVRALEPGAFTGPLDEAVAAAG